MRAPQLWHIQPSSPARLRVVASFLRVLRRAAWWGGVFLLLLYCYARVAFGSFRNMSAYFRGDAVLAELDVLDLGQVRQGKDYAAAFVVRNISADPVGLLGARTCCGCRLLSQSPIALKPNEEATILFAFHVAAGQTTGPVKRHALLLVDKGGGYGPLLTIQAEVIDAPRLVSVESAQ